jgi:hypothetical protein
MNLMPTRELTWDDFIEMKRIMDAQKMVITDYERINKLIRRYYIFPKQFKMVGRLLKHNNRHHFRKYKFTI